MKFGFIGTLIIYAWILTALWFLLTYSFANPVNAGSILVWFVVYVGGVIFLHVARYFCFRDRHSVVSVILGILIFCPPILLLGLGLIETSDPSQAAKNKMIIGAIALAMLVNTSLQFATNKMGAE